jgi:hypothetical protein
MSSSDGISLRYQLRLFCERMHQTLYSMLKSQSRDRVNSRATMRESSEHVVGPSGVAKCSKEDEARFQSSLLSVRCRPSQAAKTSCSKVVPIISNLVKPLDLLFISMDSSRGDSPQTPPSRAARGRSSLMIDLARARIPLSISSPGRQSIAEAAVIPPTVHSANQGDEPGLDCPDII